MAELQSLMHQVEHVNIVEYLKAQLKEFPSHWLLSSRLVLWILKCLGNVHSLWQLNILLPTPLLHFRGGECRIVDLYKVRGCVHLCVSVSMCVCIFVDVSVSMAGFLAGENLCGTDLSESAVDRAMRAAELQHAIKVTQPTHGECTTSVCS